MEIEIDKIIVEKQKTGGWNVIVGDYYSDTLGYDECLGLLATLIVDNSHKNCLSWLKTKEQHDKWNNRNYNPEPKSLKENESI